MYFIKILNLYNSNEVFKYTNVFEIKQNNDKTNEETDFFDDSHYKCNIQ
jgi:hypothetical protein